MAFFPSVDHWQLFILLFKACDGVWRSRRAGPRGEGRGGLVRGGAAVEAEGGLQVGGQDVNFCDKQEDNIAILNVFYTIRMTGPRLGFGAVSLPRSDLCLPTDN